MTWLRNLWDKLFGSVEVEFPIHDAGPLLFPDQGVSTFALNYLIPFDPNRTIRHIVVTPHIWAECNLDMVINGNYRDRHGMFHFAPTEEAGFRGSHICHAWTGLTGGGILTIRVSDQYAGDSGQQAALDAVVVFSKHARTGIYRNGGLDERQWLEEIAYWGEAVTDKRKGRKSR